MPKTMQRWNGIIATLFLVSQLLLFPLSTVQAANLAVEEEVEEQTVVVEGEPEQLEVNDEPTVEEKIEERARRTR